jgi:hypothetical protein
MGAGMKNLVLFPVTFVDFYPHGTRAQIITSDAIRYPVGAGIPLDILHECTWAVFFTNLLFYGTKALSTPIETFVEVLTLVGTLDCVGVKMESHV